MAEPSAPRGVLEPSFEAVDDVPFREESGYRILAPGQGQCNSPKALLTIATPMGPRSANRQFARCRVLRLFIAGLPSIDVLGAEHHEIPALRGAEDEQAPLPL